MAKPKFLNAKASFAAQKLISDEDLAVSAWARLRKRALTDIWEDGISPARLTATRDKITKALARAKGGKRSLLERVLARLGKASRPLTATEKVGARLLVSMIDWRLTGTFTAPWENANEARLQFWDTEWHCPITAYQIALLRAAHERFPAIPSFGSFLKVYELIDPAAPAMRERLPRDFQVVMTPGAKRTIVGFAGHSHSCLGIGWPTFYRVGAVPAEANLIVLRDMDRVLFLAGTHNFGPKAETIAALREVLARPEFASTEIVFLGASSGTFGALNLGGPLGIKRYVGLSGPTSLDIGLGNEDKHVYQKVEALAAEGKVGFDDPVASALAGGIERIDYFVGAFNEFDMQHGQNLADRVPGAVIHKYPTPLHNITDFCVCDGRLLAALRGENPAPATV